MENASNLDANKVLAVMTRLWDYFPGTQQSGVWKDYATGLAEMIRSNKPRADMDFYMSRAQLYLKMHSSMDFRKIVDQSIDALGTAAPSTVPSERVQKLNPTTA